jgi:hypothetical protein
MQSVLKNEEHLNEVFKVLYQKMSNKSPNEERLAYKALFEFSKVYYMYLQPYLEAMLQTIIGHIQQHSLNTVFALELLDIIGTQYRKLMENKE